MELVVGFILGLFVTDLLQDYTVKEQDPKIDNFELLMRSRERLRVARKEAATRAKQYVKDEVKLRKSARSIVA